MQTIILVKKNLQLLFSKKAFLCFVFLYNFMLSNLERYMN